MELRIPEDELRNAYEVICNSGEIFSYSDKLVNLCDYRDGIDWFSKYDFLEYFGNKLSVEILFGQTPTFNALASFLPGSSKIIYTKFCLTTILHELSHAIHHSFVNIIEMDSCEREIVAEFSSYILANYLGDSKNNFANMIYILGNTNGWHSVTEQSIDKAKAIIEQYSDDILRICNTAIQWLQEAGEQHS